MPRCCYCNADVRPQFDFCAACNALHTAHFGPDWTRLDWHQETVGISRRERYAERREVALADLSPAEQAQAQPVQPLGPDALDQLITQALATAPGTGWRRMHRLIAAQGIDVTAEKVRWRLRRIQNTRR